MITAFKKRAVNPREYLQVARKYALKNNYDPNKLSFSDNEKYKLNYDGVDFGSSMNNDFIIYSLLNKRGIDTNPQIHRSRYLARSGKIGGDWKNNKLSKNNLSRRILWNA
jgi:hypothetical protein